MSNGTVGSSSSPSWAGWDWPGSGYAFHSNYTTPGHDIWVTNLHAYFNTHNGNGAIGWLCVWQSGNDGGALLISIQKGIINNSSLGAGTQQWWSAAVNPPYLISASTSIDIGGYCNQGLLFSTYDTSPTTWVNNMGTGGPGDNVNYTNINQGPCGAYLEYSNAVYGNPTALGTYYGGGILGFRPTMVVQSGVDTLGVRAAGGLYVPTTVVLAVSQTNLGSNGGGIVGSSAVKRPTIYTWRRR